MIPTQKYKKYAGYGKIYFCGRSASGIGFGRRVQRAGRRILPEGVTGMRIAGACAIGAAEAWNLPAIQIAGAAEAWNLPAIQIAGAAEA